MSRSHYIVVHATPQHSPHKPIDSFTPCSLYLTAYEYSTMLLRRADDLIGSLWLCHYCSAGHESYTNIQLTENEVANREPGGTEGEDTADPGIAVSWGLWGSSWWLPLKPASRKRNNIPLRHSQLATDLCMSQQLGNEVERQGKANKSSTPRIAPYFQRKSYPGCLQSRGALY